MQTFPIFQITYLMNLMAYSLDLTSRPWPSFEFKLAFFASIDKVKGSLSFIVVSSKIVASFHVL